MLRVAAASLRGLMGAILARYVETPRHCDVLAGALCALGCVLLAMRLVVCAPAAACRFAPCTSHTVVMIACVSIMMMVRDCYTRGHTFLPQSAPIFARFGTSFLMSLQCLSNCFGDGTKCVHENVVSSHCLLLAALARCAVGAFWLQSSKTRRRCCAKARYQQRHVSLRTVLMP